MDDDDQATEGVADGVGGPDVSGHVLIRVFRAFKAAVQRVDTDRYGLQVAKLFSNVSNERAMIASKRKRCRHEKEGRRTAISPGKLGLAECVDAAPEAFSTFKRAVDYGACRYAMGAVLPAEGNVHEQVKGPK